jgi:hypothetical protein
VLNKGNNKITELRTIFQSESQNSQVYKQTKSVNNRKTENRNDPDLVQAFLKKWWVESDFKLSQIEQTLVDLRYDCLQTTTVHNVHIADKQIIHILDARTNRIPQNSTGIST